MVAVADLEGEGGVAGELLAALRIGKIGFVHHARFPKALAQRDDFGAAVG